MHINNFKRSVLVILPSCNEPHYESEAKCEVFIMKISFHSYAKNNNSHMKS